MSTNPPLMITVDHIGNWTVVGLDGDLDVATSPELETACENASGPLALEMSDLRFVDSSGLRGLIRIRDAADALVMVAPSGVVRRLLALTQMTEAFQIVDSLDGLESSA